MTERSKPDINLILAEKFLNALIDKRCIKGQNPEDLLNRLLDKNPYLENPDQDGQSTVSKIRAKIERSKRQ